MSTPWTRAESRLDEDKEKSTLIGGKRKYRKLNEKENILTIQ